MLIRKSHVTCLSWNLKNSKMYKFIIISCIYLYLQIVSFVRNEDKVDICSLSSCANATIDINGDVAKFCTSHNYTISGHCCFTPPAENSSSLLVGLDLVGCKVSSLLELNFTHNNTEHKRETLQWLALEDNPFQHCDNSTSFQGITNISYLSLPFSCGCPGGNDAWNAMSQMEDHTVCLGEKNMCLIEDGSCPNSSFCKMNSPGVSWCLCDAGYYGYKCLRQGKFPYITFGCGLSGAMVAAAGFLWVTQRRFVKKQQ